MRSLLTVVAVCGLAGAAEARGPLPAGVERARAEASKLTAELQEEFGPSMRQPTPSRGRFIAGPVGGPRRDLAGPVVHAPTAGATGPKTVMVDCTKPGASIQDAVDKKGDPLTVIVSGICVENVEIARDRVTLIGGDPATDGIRAAGNGDPRESALIIRDARSVRVENLTLQGAAWTGLRVIDSYDSIEIVDCRLEDNAIRGSSVISSLVNFTDVVFTANGYAPPGTSRGGLVIAFGARAVCERCTITDNPAPGVNSAVAAFGGAEGFFNDSDLEGANGLLALDFSVLAADDTSTISAGTFAFLGDTYADGTLSGTPFDGTITLFQNSSLRLRGATQGTTPFPTVVEDNSSLVLDDLTVGPPPVSTPSTLTDTVFLLGFSNAQVEGGSTVTSLLCLEVSDVYCDGTETKTGSTCTSCP